MPPAGPFTGLTAPMTYATMRVQIGGEAYGQDFDDRQGTFL